MEKERKETLVSVLHVIIEQMNMRMNHLISHSCLFIAKPQETLYLCVVCAETIPA